MTTFVLVHGNWHNGTAWCGVRRHLLRLGHPSYAPTLPRHAAGIPSNIGYREAAAGVARVVIDRDLRDVVLVGHSGGGVAISLVVEAIPDRVERLVYVSGWILQDGEALIDMTPAHYRDMFSDLAAQTSDRTVEVPFDVWRNHFINDADEERARTAYQQLVPEPYSYLVQPVTFSSSHRSTVPTSYILPTEDISLPRDDTWGWHPRMTSRLGEHRFLEMPGSHEVMFTNPDGLARTILDACK